MLAVISSLSIAISLADTWLHTVTSATVYSQTVWATGTGLSTPAVAYGTEFNNSACSSLNNVSLAVGPTNFCGQGAGVLWTQDPSFLMRGWAIAGNRSIQHLITTLNDEDWMAIITRADVPGNETYIAHSFGLTASCTPLASLCNVNIEGNVNCSNLGLGAAGFPNGSSGFTPWKSGAQLLQGSSLSEQQMNSSLFSTLVELWYTSANSEIAPGPPPNDAILSNVSPVNGTNSNLLITNCSFAAYDIVIRVAPGTQTVLVSQVNASDETTARLWPGILYNSIRDALVVNTRGLALTSGSGQEVMADLSQEIARLTLAIAAATMAPIAPTEVGVVNSKFISAYPFPPLAVFLGLLFVYSVIVIALFLWCAFVSSPTLEVREPGKKPATVGLIQLVGMRLTNPLSFVATAFATSSSALFPKQDHIAPTDRLLSLQTDTEKLFIESANTPRLHTGFIAEYDTENEVSRFEIKQSPIGHSSTGRDGELGRAAVPVYGYDRTVSAYSTGANDLEYTPYPGHPEGLMVQ